MSSDSRQPPELHILSQRNNKEPLLFYFILEVLWNPVHRQSAER